MISGPSGEASIAGPPSLRIEYSSRFRARSSRRAAAANRDSRRATACTSSALAAGRDAAGLLDVDVGDPTPALVGGAGNDDAHGTLARVSGCGLAHYSNRPRP